MTNVGRKLSAGILLSSAALLSSCKVGPNYSRPPVNAPAQYRGPAGPATTAEAQDKAAPASTASFGDEKWWTVFQDPVLQKLVRTAVQQNYDVQIAASRILQAEAQVKITRADQFPTASVSPQYQIQRIPIGGSAFGYNLFSIVGSGSWNIDFWGQYRRATEAARDQLLAAEYNRRAVISSLVSNVATTYFQLRELDLEKEISQRTLQSRRDSLKLTETLSNGGSVSLLDVKQAQQLVETAAATIPRLEQQIGQTEDALSILLGENPHDITRGQALADQVNPDEIPAGLPSRLLERRPDVQQAEQQLASATAQIGVAKARFFPSVSLTGSGGVASVALGRIFTDPGYLWTGTGGIAQTVFAGGRLTGNLNLAKAAQQEQISTYKQTVQRAFQQVSDALIAYRKTREQRERQEALVVAARDASNLSHMRYEGGVTSYLEVLTNETNLYSAELSLAQSRLEERLSLVSLYYALGGGWDQS